MAMQTRSVRVDSDALKLAEPAFAANGTSFSGFVRKLVEYVAQTGRLPKLENETPSSADEGLLVFEAFAEELTLSVDAGRSYASASARDLLADALAERYV